MVFFPAVIAVVFIAYVGVPTAKKCANLYVCNSDIRFVQLKHCSDCATLEEVN